MTSYKCPKCGGTETYFAPRLGIDSQGKQAMVDTAICHACGEVCKKVYASTGPSWDEIDNSFWGKYRINIIWWGFLAVVGLTIYIRTYG